MDSHDKLPEGMVVDSRRQPDGHTTQRIQTVTSPQPTTTPTAPAQQKPVEVDQMKLDMLMQRLRGNQNLSMALLGGLGAAVVGAVLWAFVTAITGWQIGFMAIGVGFLVGFAVRGLGNGVDKSFGYVGAGLSMVGCLLGNLLASCVFIAQSESAGIFDVIFSLTPAAIGEIFTLTFSPIDLIFYGLALYYGYRYSFRQLTEAELKSVVKH
jgi:hypothetical protein